MSLSRLSAGTGYRYLLRHTASADIPLARGESLTAYYAATGNPPGRWLGSGLAALGAGELTAGAVVTEAAMAALYGAGLDPVTGEQLGRRYPVFKSAAARIADAIAGLPAELPDEARAAAVAGIEAHVRARPSRSAVAGFDLTFTVPKSASVLWALGDQHVQDQVVAAHRAAIDSVLALVEDRFLHTRIGAQSCAQVSARGLIAAAFDHFDSRAGDPHLHTHVVVANKVQGPDGQWRSVDGQKLYRAAVALSEIYNDLFADQLTARLPVSWSWRERGPRSSPVFEIDGIDDELLATFSQRSVQIGAQLEDLVADFTAQRGREPSRTQVLRLRQRATLATRPDKQIRPLAELREAWRATATATTGKRPDRLVGRALAERTRVRPATAAIDLQDQVAVVAETVLAGVAVRRPTWTRANLLAEAARATRHLRLTDTAERVALLDQVVDHALARCVALDPPELFHTPARFRRLNGTSVFDRPSEAAFTTTAVLDAEARLLAAMADLTASAVPAAVLAPLDRPMPGQRLSPDQHAAITGIATSHRRLDVLIGPAGTGKTKTLAILTRAWAHAHGHGTVLGLAPSAAAAAELARSLQIPCENTAKWLHDHDRPVPPTPAPPVPLAGALDGALAGTPPVQVTGPAPMRPGMLVIVDEASLASTAHLDALLGHASAVGAKLLLVGDDHQLNAVDAGGAFALLAEDAITAKTAHTLDALWRFTNRWEADATCALRTGDPAVIAAYAEHGRLHDGDTAAMTEAAYLAWQADLTAGKTSLLLAPDRHTVTALNLRARDDRLAAGHVTGPEIALRDGTACAAGDWVITRQNDRRLRTHDGGHVRNGAAWTVAAVHPDGTIDAIPRELRERTPDQGPAQPQLPLRLPARYVAEHVELGYASTIHRAQGATVDTAHVLANDGMTRQALYVAMTRGRQANHAYVPLDGYGEEHQANQLTGPQILNRIVATDGAEHSATATMRQLWADAASPGRLTPIRETLRAGQEIEAADELTRLITIRASLQRAATVPADRRQHMPAPLPRRPGRKGPEPIGR